MNNPGQNSAPSLTGGNPEEVINLPCPSCGKILNLRRKHLGIRGKCVHCHNGVTAVLDSVGAATLVADLAEKHEEPEEAPATSSHAFAPAAPLSPAPAPAPEPEPAASSWGPPAPSPATQADEPMPPSEPLSQPENSFQNQSPAPFSGTDTGFPAPLPAPLSEETEPTPTTPVETESFGATAPGFLSAGAPAAETQEEAPAPAASPFGQAPQGIEDPKPESHPESVNAFPSADFSGTPTQTTSGNEGETPAFGGGFAAPAPTAAPESTPDPEPTGFMTPASPPEEEPSPAPFSGGFTSPAPESDEPPAVPPKAEEKAPEPSFTGGFTQATAPAESPSSPFGAREDNEPTPKPEPAPESASQESSPFASGFSASASSPAPTASPFGAPQEEKVFADEPSTSSASEPEPATEPASDGNEVSGFTGGFLAAKPAKETPADEPKVETPAAPAFQGAPASSPFGSPSNESKAASPFSTPQASTPPEIPAEPAPEPKQEAVTVDAETLPGTTAGFISPPPIPDEAAPKLETGTEKPEPKKEEPKASPFEEKREKFTPTDPPAGLSPFTTGSAQKSQPGFAEALFDKKEEEKPAITPPEKPSMPSAEAVAASAADQQWGPSPAEKKDLEAMAAVTATASKASLETQDSEEAIKPSRMVLKGKGNTSGSVLKLAKTFILSVILAGIGFAAYKFTPEEKWLEWKDKAVEWLEPGAVILQDTPFAKPAEEPSTIGPAVEPEQKVGPSEEEPDTFRVE